MLCHCLIEQAVITTFLTYGHIALNTHHIDITCAKWIPPLDYSDAKDVRLSNLKLMVE